MKKFLSILLLSIASIITVNAQGVIGVKGGLSHSGILVANPDGGLIPGFVGGITYDLPISNKLTFGAEVLFSQQGVYKNSNTSQVVPPVEGMIPESLTYGIKGETNIRLNYVNIPLVVKYGFGENNNFKLFGGGQVGFLVNSNLTWDGNVTLAGNETGNDYSEHLPTISGVIENETGVKLPASNADMQAAVEQQEFKKVDFAFVVGASYDFGETPLSLDFRANYGMVDINANADATDSDYMKNMSLQLTLKYSIFGKN